MWKQPLVVILAALWLLNATSDCLPKELLFQAETADCGDYERASRRLCELYRTEFVPRMFPHGTWHQRLSYSSYEPDVNETLEIYSKPDGSRWLSHRRASPSLTEIIARRDLDGAKFDLKEKLDAVRITSHEVALSAKLAQEIEVLWQTMLPGVPRTQFPRIVTTHAPVFDAWVRKDHSVETGRIPMAVYNTPIYRAFVDVITDLRQVCDRGDKSSDPILKRLPSKIRRLRAELEKP